MADIHDRMPVFLAPEMTADWLDPALVGDQHLVDAVSTAAILQSQYLRVYEVLPLRGDGPGLLDPVSR